MVSGVGAYQQQAQVQQSSPQREQVARESKVTTEDRDSSATRSAGGVSRSDERSREVVQRRAEDLAARSAENASGLSAGKDSAQKRGSLLDVTA